jgi:benzoate-CoA ligase family protein
MPHGEGIGPWQAPAGRYNAAVDLVDRHVAEGRGAKAAFVDPGRRLRYVELKAGTDRFGAGLRRLGVMPEQRVALILLDTVDFPVAFWGAIKAGIVAVPLNTLLPNDQWRYMLEDSRAAAVVISASLLDRAAPMLAELRASRPLPLIVAGGPAPPGVLTLEGLLDSAPADPPAPETHADEVAFWLYTSGSTGKPKAARHLHASPASTAALYGRGVLGIEPDDVIYSAAKLFFAYGLGNAMSFPLSVGATAVLLPERPTPESVLATLRAHQPTVFCGVPTLYAGLLATPGLGPRAGSARLRACVSAGEALPEEIGRRWRETVGIDVLDGLGSTEMLHIFVSNRPGDVRYGSTGKPVPGYEARVVDELGAPVLPGEIGELLVNGPTAADGYWNQRERSRKTFAGEWTHTGDKYRVDRDGYYHYCGRTDDMFKVGGNWVSPFEVESALLSHGAVLEAAVIGRQDAEGLTKPKAFVVLKPGRAAGEALFEELRAHVKEAVGPWKYPRWIEARSELPKTATGKIQRFKLRAEG